MTEVPFMNLSDCYEEVHDDIMKKINELIDNTRFIGGDEVDFFENEFAEYCNMTYCAGCANGTDALMLTLSALGIGEGDTVLTVPNTFVATAEAITNVGADIDFIDISEQYYTMDPDKLEDYLKRQNSVDNIKAVIPVHLYGQMADMEKIMEIADKYDLKVIEDAAQAHGAELNGKRPGEYSGIATFSFYPGKNLGAWGDAGAIVMDNEKTYKKVQRLTDHGRINEKYTHQIPGYNSRLDSIQAAILRIKLKYLEKWTKERIKNAEYYNKILEDKKIVRPKIKENAQHVFHLYVIRSNNRKRLQQKLSNNNISTGIHYPIPLHLQPAYNYLGYKKGDFPITEKTCNEVLSLPMWPEIKKEQLNYIGKNIK